MVKKQNIPIVHTIRDYYLLCPKTTMFYRGENRDPLPLFSRALSFPRKMMSQYVDAVIGVSKFTLDRHLKDGYFRKAKIKKHIYNISSHVKSTVKSACKKKDLVFGYVGRISPAKGVDRMLDEVSTMTGKNWQLKIFGEGETEKYLDTLKSKYSSDKIIFAGYEKVDKIFTEIDLLIVSSLWHEPFPRVVIESFTHGVPVVSTNTGGTRELMEEGKTGFSYDPFKKGELKTILLGIIEHQYDLASMSEYVKDISREFDEDIIINKYLDVYRRIL